MKLEYNLIKDIEKDCCRDINIVSYSSTNSSIDIVPNALNIIINRTSSPIYLDKYIPNSCNDAQFLIIKIGASVYASTGREELTPEKLYTYQLDNDKAVAKYVSEDEVIQVNLIESAR